MIDWENKEEEIEISYALDEQSNKDYQYSEYELFINKEQDETTKWVFSPRPQETKIWNQGNTPACTCYSLIHVCNWENLLEDDNLWEDRPQQDPLPIWKQFCVSRGWNTTTWSSIQTMAQYFKDHWMISWYVTIKSWEKDEVVKIKKALDMWKFISTGSSNWDWTKTKATGIYTLRTDSKFVWHARCIVDYGDGYFWAVNSYGDKRWKYNWYFRVPFDLLPKIYSKLVIIDKDDSGSYSKLREYKKAQEMLKLAKELYMNWNKEQKQYFEQIMLTKNIETLYKVA
jgi:hypothetical protein